ncbi:MAG: 8-amino-7-oxononanoate synthase [Gammaproteobacteria bacterium]|nr:8-amino-7-oxononanoate synthase [Gammaproteobacteria bacterium]
MIDLGSRLQQRRLDRLYRTRPVLDGPQAAQVSIDGRQYVAFCSNDYLGLANHPAVIAALARGAERYGAGSGASHLISGHSRAHQELEAQLAAYTGRPRALLFSTGYMANLGVLGALAQRGDRIYADRLSHASLIDAAQLAGGRLRRYPHNDAAQLQTWLQRATDRGQRFVVTDGVFSMDGDLAPLDRLAALARERHAWLMVDDAHGLGVIGPGGRGSLAHYGLGVEAAPILVGTLGKAFGTFGAFVAGGEELIETLIQFARTYIYTTALPPAIACATSAAVQLAQTESWRREQLSALIQRFHQGARQLGLPVQIPVGDSPLTPIVPLIVGESAAALAASAALQQRGLLISAIRPPTVPRGSARLRITFSASHTEEQIDRLLDALAEILA